MKQDCIRKIKDFTKCGFIRFMPSGDAATFAAFYLAKQVNQKAFMLIPDAAGWLSYEKFPKILGFDVRRIKTDSGVVDLADLDENIEKGSAFIFSNPAGYFAEQPLSQIYDVCKGKCICILDVSGSLGDEVLCNGNNADIVIGSFGKWKPVNLGYGGFIAAKENIFARHADFFRMFKTNINYAKLYEKLSDAGKRLEFFYRKAGEIKKDLAEFDIVHRDKKGINVVVRFKHEAEKEKIIKYCDDTGYEYTLCPRYLRVNEDAVSIEVKRLE
jgi:dTDP-4-amino-4,6-dideoxygalactose transaminase